MTLRDLVLKMGGDEKLMVRRLGESEMLETNPDEIINDYESLHAETVSTIWASHNLYNAIMIELE